MKMTTTEEFLKPVVFEGLLTPHLLCQMSGRECAVGLAMLATLDANNVTTLNLTEIANFCGIDKGTASRCAKALTGKSFCQPVSGNGGTIHFRISPHFAQVGLVSKN